MEIDVFRLERDFYWIKYQNQLNKEWKQLDDLFPNQEVKNIKKESLMIRSRL